MKTITVNEVRLSSIRLYRGKMPIGILTDETGEEVGYLSPFRYYAFQVSATFDGEGDMGSSPVFGLNNILDARLGTSRNIGSQSNLTFTSTKIALLKAMALEAINESMTYISRWKGETMMFIDNTEVTESLGDGRALPFYGRATTLDRFIALTVKAVNSDAYNAYTILDDDNGAELYWEEQAAGKHAKDEKDIEFAKKRLEFIHKDKEDLKTLMAQYSGATA